MSNAPKVTVLMPVYNVALYVAEAINSILNQTYKDFELLIINDGSIDNTRDEVLKFSDTRIRFVENEKNIGLANTLNKGLELARGEYIARMDGDDISLPERLAKQVAILNSRREIDICGAGYRFFGNKNYSAIYPEHHEDIKIGLLFGCCMIIPLFRRQSILEADLKYNQKYFPAEDYRFWTECIHKLKMYNIPEVLFLYRMHATQVSEVMTDQLQISNMVRIAYFKSLFPKVDKAKAETFVCNFSGAVAVNSIADYYRHKKLVEELTLINKLNAIFPERLFNTKLLSHVHNELAVYVNERWFTNRYTPAGLIKLFCSGLFCQLSAKLRFKLIIKSILLKKKKMRKLKNDQCQYVNS